MRPTTPEEAAFTIAAPEEAAADAEVEAEEPVEEAWLDNRSSVESTGFRRRCDTHVEDEPPETLEPLTELWLVAVETGLVLVALTLDAGVLDTSETAEVVESVAETESDPDEAALEAAEVAAEVSEVTAPESVKQLESPGEKKVVSLCQYAGDLYILPVFTMNVPD